VGGERELLFFAGMQKFTHEKEKNSTQSPPHPNTNDKEDKKNKNS